MRMDFKAGTKKQKIKRQAENRALITLISSRTYVIRKKDLNPKWAKTVKQIQDT